MAEFGGSATAEETAGTTTIAATDDSETKGEVTFRESGRIVVGKKGRRAKAFLVFLIYLFIGSHSKCFFNYVVGLAFM